MCFTVVFATSGEGGRAGFAVFHCVNLLQVVKEVGQVLLCVSLW